MQPRFSKQLVWLAGMAVLAVAGVPAFAQDLAWIGSRKSCPPAPCPVTPAPSPAPAPGATPPTPSELVQPPTTELALDQRFAGLGGETVAVPNMIGDLLFTSRSVNFGFVRVNGTTDFLGLSSTSIVNANVAENNSPLPADRVYFRYNFFSEAQSVTGLSPNTAVLFASPPGSPFPPALVQLPQTRKYDTNLYTFGLEKTFLDNWMSVELRVPFVTGLASQNTFSVGTPSGPASFFGFTTDPLGNPLFNVTSTPQNTLGHEDTEFGDLTVILKGLFYRNRDRGLSLSGGLGILIPTGEDTDVRVIDFSSFSFIPFASFQRERDIHIANETASLSPFLAALYVPSEKLFTQGFAAVEVPVGSSRITYVDQNILGKNPPIPAPGTPGPAGTLFPPFAVNRSINEQTLLHIDWNIGYWIYRDRDSAWLSGIAPCFEVHYTGTLDNADRVQLPGNANVVVPNPANPALGSPETGPVVGGSQNHINIVDLTAGATFAFGRRTMLATAFTVPVTNASNRAFDWEFQLQLNYYWGR